MREIEFRGKRRDNGEWIEGLLFRVLDSGTQLVIQSWLETDDEVTLVCAVVDPTTIGQYTGTKDENGKKIYEGDIVKGSLVKGYCLAYEVLYSEDEAIFYCATAHFGGLVSGGRQTATLKNAEHWLEVIGNIHDDPELLEVE